jgi:S-DNA-T family DNA segregation ATPase FtsK/SpoIIIE
LPDKSVLTNLTEEQLDVVAKVTLKLIELGLEVEFIPPVSVGPIVSVYRFQPQKATRVTHIESLAADIAVVLGIKEDILIKRMPGDSAVGIFVPNKERKFLDFKDAVKFLWLPNSSTKEIPLLLGVDHLGTPVVDDLAQLPHLLIAGSTGSGKSTLVASMLAAIIYKLNSSVIQFVLSDTKQVEFGYFVGAPHLLYEPAKSVFQSLEQLEWCCEEIESRLKAIGKASCRNFAEYNLQMNSKLPRIVVVIDELADLLMDTSKSDDKIKLGKLAEGYISKIVQKARASGIHLIACTQQASVKIVAGYIKANFPARLSFRLPSESDSRTILNTGGAEHLLSPGDMLYISPIYPGIRRIHAPHARIEDIQMAVEMACRREASR